MGPSELLSKLVGVLDAQRVPYLITGSTASIAYGEPRMTIDIDVVVDLPFEKVSAFCAAFPAPGFYSSEPSALEAARKRTQFNIIHPASGLKVDVIFSKDTEFDRTRLLRAVRVPLGTVPNVSLASAEDVILKKLQFFQQGGADKHIRDIAGVLKIRGPKLERAYIDAWAQRLGVQQEWELAQRRAGPQA